MWVNSRVVIWKGRRQNNKGCTRNRPNISTHQPLSMWCCPVTTCFSGLRCRHSTPTLICFISFTPSHSQHELKISLGLSFVHSFSVLTPFLMLMRGLLDTCLICLFQNNHFNQSGSLSKNGGHLEWGRSRAFWKRSSKISCQTSPEGRHQFRRKLRQLHPGNRWCLFLWGIAQLSRDMLHIYRCACVKLSAKGGYRTVLGECQLPWKSIARYAIWGIAAIVSQYRAIWGH